jgi:cytochrome c55X
LNQVKDGRPVPQDDALSAADCPPFMSAHRPLPLNRVPLPPWVASATWCLAAGVLALAAAQAAAQEGGVPRVAPGVRADREPALIRMVRQDCGSCHGMRLTGGLGPALTREALADKPLDGLAATIFQGRPGTPMPPWRALLSEAESWWIAEQLMRGFPEEGRAQP